MSSLNATMIDKEAGIREGQREGVWMGERRMDGWREGGMEGGEGKREGGREGGKGMKE